MRSGAWGGARSTDNVRVTVNGTRLPVKDVRIQSGMRDGHPQSDSGSWCVEATIDWTAPPLVFSGAPHLFGAGSEWMPRAGDSVVIETGDGALDQWWVQHRGVIDDTSGSFADGTAQSTTVDNIEDLGNRVQFGALLHRMTPWADGGTWRHIGLSSIYMVDRMYRNPQTPGVGWYATPPATWQAVASAPMNGSAWPEIGTLRLCGRSPEEPGGQIFGWSNVSYGVAPFGIYSEYIFDSPVSECILSCSTEQSGVSTAATRYHAQNADGYGPFIRIDRGAGEIQYGLTTSGTLTYRVPIESAKRASLFFRRDTTTQQTLILRTDDGREDSRTVNATGFPNGFTMDRIFVNTTEQGRAGWWMVEGEKIAAQRWATLESTPTARLRRGADVRWLASWDMPFTEPAQWLGEQVDAECACMWLDEDNHMQWASRGVLEAQSVATTITSVRDVDDIQWERRRSSLARGVWINYAEPKIRTYSEFRNNAWETDSIDLAPGEAETVTVSIPDDEDWISVDLNSSLMTPAMAPWQLRIGSKHGGTQYTETASGETGQTWAQFVDYTLTRDGLRTFSVYFAPWANLGNVRVKSAIPNLNDKDTRPSANIDGWHSGNAAVRIRSRGITQWTEGERSLTAGTIGPARLTHDVGRRVQNMHIVDSVGELLSWLRGEVMVTTKPRITGLTIAHDPRLQIGDKIRIRDTAITGVDFDVLIQQRDLNVTDMTETIQGRVTVVRVDVPNGPLVTDWTSRYEPGGHTPITPESNWDREAVS